MFSRESIGTLALILLLSVPSILSAQEGVSEGDPVQGEAGQEAAAEKEDSGQLQIIDGVIATGMENLLPQGLGESFPSTVGTLYAFTRVLGAEGETRIIHKWYHGDQLRAEIPLPVRSENWRTYSSKKILPEWTGGWKVEVSTPEGAVLQTLTFRVE